MKHLWIWALQVKLKSPYTYSLLGSVCTVNYFHSFWWITMKPGMCNWHQVKMFQTHSLVQSLQRWFSWRLCVRACACMWDLGRCVCLCVCMHVFLILCLYTVPGEAFGTGEREFTEADWLAQQGRERQDQRVDGHTQRKGARCYHWLHCSGFWVVLNYLCLVNFVRNNSACMTKYTEKRVK